jgi:hypothetical protein
MLLLLAYSCVRFVMYLYLKGHHFVSSQMAFFLSSVCTFLYLIHLNTTNYLQSIKVVNMRFEL